MQFSLKFPSGEVQYMLNSSFEAIETLYPKDQCVIITDTNVAKLYGHLFKGFKTVITIPAGEKNKNCQMVNTLATQLLMQKVHRKNYIIGVGGGVVSDMTGFIASVYMRGIPFGFVPTTLLGMVDAAIGGKNGVNLGMQKNLLGTIQQPNFILYDTKFLETLPGGEWSNGFAEIIKYAMLFDERMFSQLNRHDITYYKESPTALAALIESCVNLKNKRVLADEQETGARKLLNFGHTVGHAIETLNQLPHGYAVGLGMIMACHLSEHFGGLHSSVKNKLAALLLKYQLPISADFNTTRVMEILRMDKKGDTNTVNFIMLQHIGEAVIRPIPFEAIERALTYFTYASSY